MANPTNGPLPVGTVTFLLTDVEGSTTGWEADRGAMAAAIVRHYEILDAAVRARGGVRPVEQGEGDSVVAVFSLASEAVRVAVDIQLALAAEPWPDGAHLALRMALHTGEAQMRDAGNYMGRAVIRTARLRAIGHGGQILCSASTADLAGDDLPDGVALVPLGAHRLKDLGRPEQVFQVCHPGLRREFPPLRSLDAIPNNLPVYLTSFIGREAELADLARLAGQHRLVTLTGSGGVGKTRLAAAVAAELAGSHPDGAWWVELAPLADPALVTEAVLGVLQVGDAPGSSATQRLTAHLATRDLLVVLDNCEHVLDACAAMSEAVLRTCPGVAVVATSREALGVGGEVTWRVPPLALPFKGDPCPVESLGSYDAVRLFVDRAVKARPNFAVTNATAPVVAEICARLDGIPLAIELAAARIRVLSPQQILDGLEDRFRLLTGGTRGGMRRQQTLEASVAWSHDLLTPEERVLFRRLSVFAGGFTLDAAEYVGAGSGPGCEPAAVLDLLQGLADKSLVVVEDDLEGTASRYHLLETIRDFAALELARAEETAPARDAHLSVCLDSARQWEEAYLGVTPVVIRHFAAEHDNFRAALDWALAGDDPEPALDLAWRHGALLFMRGRYREGRETVERALGMPGAGPTARGTGVWLLGFLQWCLGDLDGMQASAAEVLAVAQAAGDRRLECRAHHLYALLNLVVDPEAGKASIAAGLPLAEESADAFELISCSCLRAMIAVRADDTAAALGYLDRALALSDETYGNHYWMSWSLALDGVMAVRLGSLPRGRAAVDRSIALSTGLGGTTEIGFGTGVLAEIELLEGAPERAVALADPSIRDCTEAAAYAALPYLLGVRGRALWALGHPDARAALEEAVGVTREVGDPWQHAQAVLPLARFLVSAGDLGPVEALLAEARASGAVLGSPWVSATADHAAGLLAAARGQPDRAEDLHHAALAVHAEHGYPLGVIDSLEALAVVAVGQESWAEAARLLAATAQRREKLGYRHDRALVAPAEAATRAGLGDEAFQAAWAEGEVLTIEEAVAYASRARGERKRPSSGWGSLTPTEIDVARLAAEGLSNAEIGAKLFISAGTAKVHLHHIYAKLNLANRAQLTAEVTRRGG
jgi:predicted ATPase/class 3 adenylate cyclase/DNA-binding CsgD family transcriptional regulator